MLLHVLGHVDADQRRFAVKELLRQRLGQLGLADTGRSEEQERTDRLVGVAEPGARADDRIRDRLDCLVLSNDSGMQALGDAHDALCFAFEQLGDGDSRPASDDGSDVVLGDFLTGH